MRVIVTGANRGIGLEFVRQYAARGDEVIAAARRPDEATELAALAARHGGRVTVLPCDVGDDASVAAFAKAVGDAPVDLLINNAGVGEWNGLDGLETATALAIYNVNALGPVRVTRALLPNLLQRKGSRVVSVTSGMGSIADNTSGGAYAYRMSKAALNMAGRSLAMDLRDRDVISVVINPGWVKTDMGGAGASITVAQSVSGMIPRFDALTMEDTGRFLDWRRDEGFPW